MKALVAQFIHESNTFHPSPGGLEIFRQQGIWLEGEEAVRCWATGLNSQITGSIEELESAGWEVCPVFVATCGTPAGRLSAEAFQTIRETLGERLRDRLPVDGMILHLHGAACAIGEDDLEGNLLEMLREEFTGRLVVSLDLHANITRRMAQLADAITAYRTMPHTDFHETGRRAARLLMDPRKTKRLLAKIPAIIPPTDTSDEEGPFAEILSEARVLEQLHGVLDVSAFPVQPWMDAEELGTALVATVIEDFENTEILKPLASTWYAHRHEWKTGLREWPEILPLLEPNRDGPWILVDSADATTAGSPGDSAMAIARLWDVRDSLPGEIFLHVVDPAAVVATRRGDSPIHVGAQQFPIKGEIRFLGEGRYRPRGRSYTGIELSMGDSAVIAAGQLRIVLCSSGSLAADPAFYECLGLDTDKALAVHVKSLTGWKTGYDAHPSRGLIFDGPGVASLDFCKLPFTGARRDLFPLGNSQPIELWQSH